MPLTVYKTLHNRFLARSVLIPFVHEAPPLSLNTLESLLDSAPAAIPEALQVGRFLGEVPAEDVYDL